MQPANRTTSRCLDFQQQGIGRLDADNGVNCCAHRARRCSMDAAPAVPSIPGIRRHTIAAGCAAARWVAAPARHGRLRHGRQGQRLADRGFGRRQLHRTNPPSQPAAQISRRRCVDRAISWRMEFDGTGPTALHLDQFEMHLALALRQSHAQAGRRRLETMALGTKQHAERATTSAASFRRRNQRSSEPCSTAAPPRIPPNSTLAQPPQSLGGARRAHDDQSANSIPAVQSRRIGFMGRCNPDQPSTSSAPRWHSTEPVKTAVLHRDRRLQQHFDQRARRPAAARQARIEFAPAGGPDRTRGSGTPAGSFSFQTRASAKISGKG